jgi:geranylgeranylglycerol-phosphate geranylgeranyltransferase
MLARELIKDAEDVEGDAASGASTLPIRIGIRKTALLAFIFAIFAVIMSFVPAVWWGLWYAGGIAIVDIVILLAAFRAIGCNTPSCIRSRGASTLLKMGFFASLIVFTLSAVFL